MLLTLCSDKILKIKFRILMFPYVLYHFYGTICAVKTEELSRNFQYKNLIKSGGKTRKISTRPWSRLITKSLQYSASNKEYSKQLQMTRVRIYTCRLHLPSTNKHGSFTITRRIIEQLLTKSRPIPRNTSWGYRTSMLSTKWVWPPTFRSATVPKSSVSIYRIRKLDRLQREGAMMVNCRQKFP